MAAGKDQSRLLRAAGADIFSQGAGISPTGTSIRTGALAAKAPTRALAKFSRGMDAKAAGAEGLGEGDEIGIVELAGDDAAAVVLLLHSENVSIGGVVEYNRDGVDAVLDGCRHLGSGEEESAVAGDAEDGPVGGSDFGAKRGGKTPAQGNLIV